MPSLNFTGVHVQKVTNCVVPRNTEEASLHLCLEKTNPSSGTPAANGVQRVSSPPVDNTVVAGECPVTLGGEGEGGSPSCCRWWLGLDSPCLPDMHHILSHLPRPPSSPSVLRAHQPCLSPPCREHMVPRAIFCASVLPRPESLIHQLFITLTQMLALALLADTDLQVATGPRRRQGTDA